MSIQPEVVAITQSQEKTCNPRFTIRACFLPIRSEIKPITRRPRVEAPPRTLKAVTAASFERPMSMAKITRCTRGKKTKSQVQKKRAVNTQNDLVCRLLLEKKRVESKP